MYSELLKDERWQARRKEILKLQNMECFICGSKEGIKHIHHKYYLPYTMPWNYPDDALITLCDTCHEDEENNLKDTAERIFKTLRRMNICSWEIERKFNETLRQLK
ncbi:MAG: hypothetical protein GY861_02635 [bacterium]|nr:hypothetical protein [bacterium]